MAASSECFSAISDSICLSRASIFLTGSNTLDSSSHTFSVLSMSAVWVSRVTWAPFRRDTVPLSGADCPAMIFISVDFPDPFTPTRPMRPPSCRAKDTSRST